jgi:hypothetical protein
MHPFIFRIEELAKKQTGCRLLLIGFWLGLLYDPEYEGDDAFLRNICELLRNCTVYNPSRKDTISFIVIAAKSSVPT